MKLEGKVAVIIGADDIGRAVATLFAKEGASVVISDVDGESADSVAREIEQAGGKALSMACDPLKREDAKKVMDLANEKFGKIDILVNNDRVIADSPAKDMTEEQWKKVLDVNLRSIFHCVQAVEKYMRKDEYKDRLKKSTGKIINVTSIAGIMGQSGRLNFSAVEAGIIGLTKQLAKEWCRYKINVNAVAHGFVDGKLGREKILGDDVAAAKTSKAMLKVPILNLWNRSATPEEIARPILFLASEDSEFITGETLHVTGGLSTGY
jgi:3-oxoacyl-[acyl-carrier protein] reductase